jgi:carbonic anhydrase
VVLRSVIPITASGDGLLRLQRLADVSVGERSLYCQEKAMFDLIYRYDPTNIELRSMPPDAEACSRSLVKGNKDFVEMTNAPAGERKAHIVPIDPRALGWGIADGDTPKQTPIAAVLGCADARVPTEMVFGKGCNELFVVRVAGNVLGQECLGSLRYAVSHFPTLKLLVVLGHSKCGAVSETVDVYLEPRRYMEIATDYSIRSIENHILVAVRVAAMCLEEIYGTQVLRGPGCRDALIEAAVALNAAWNAACLRKEFCTRSPDVRVVFGTYDLVSRYVGLPLSPPGQLTEEEKGLFAPPEDAENFRQLARRICGGKLVQSLLGEGERAA